MNLANMIDCIQECEKIAIFLEDNPETDNLESSVYFGEWIDFESSEHYNELAGLSVEKIALRRDNEGKPFLSIGIVC